VITIFRSKIDTKLVAIALAMPALGIITLVTTRHLALRPRWLPLVVAGVVVTLVLWVIFSTYYEFQADLLLVRSGPFSWRIPLKDIFSVRESTSARSGPALSMDRLEIAYGNDRVMLISPGDKAGFLAQLHRRAPHLAQPAFVVH
jgi:hypothetical protein